MASLKREIASKPTSLPLCLLQSQCPMRRTEGPILSHSPAAQPRAPSVGQAEARAVDPLTRGAALGPPQGKVLIYSRAGGWEGHHHLSSPAVDPFQPQPTPSFQLTPGQGR